MRDLHNNITVKRGISPAAAGTDNTAIVSQIVDTLGFGAVEFILNLGANTDTNSVFAVLFEDGNDSGLSDHAAVDDAFLLGTEALAGFTAADDDNKLKKIGYTGSKRYCRVTVTPTGNDSGNIFVSGLWLLGRPQSAPTSNPPT
ncbi:MAG TPA: hypothetical protein VGC26_12085 [Afipia sp.]